LTVILAPAGAPAQEPVTTEDRPEVVGGLAFIDEVELTVVSIDVFVTDKKGSAITDLEADDFVVFQDGRQRQLSHFALYTEEVISRIVQSAEDELSAMPLPTPEGTSSSSSTTKTCARWTATASWVRYDVSSKR
jgi:hypothetical protein